MLISFIIPTLNEAKILERTLLAINQLKSVPFEIIISDGRSTDNTLLIAKKYNAKVIEYAGTTRQTIGQGKNLGASIAKGDYFIFLDADVVIFKIDDFISRAVQDFSEHKNLQGLTVALKVLPEMANIPDKIIFNLANVVHYLANNIFHHGMASGEFQMVKAEAFGNLGGYNEKLAVAEDQEFFARLSKIGKTYLDWNLRVFHTSRRAHKIGWPRLLMSWWINFITLKFFKRSVNKEWKVIR